MRSELVLLSAHTPETLRALVRRWLAFLDRHPQVPITALAAQAARSQEHLPARIAVVAHDHDSLRAGLSAAVPSVARRPPRVAWVYSGGGSQWPHMGLDLAASEPVFAAALEECEALFARELGWSVRAALEDDDPARLEAVEAFHAAIFSVQWALTALWRAWSVTPAIVVGHSLGELAAAAGAGALTLADAVRVVARRGRLQGASSGRGTALVVGLPYADAAAAIGARSALVSVAATNGPKLTVLSGEVEAVRTIAAELEARGVFCRLIKGAQVAPHSPQMDGVIGPLTAALAGLSPRAGHTPVLSTVDLVRSDGARLDAAYWARNLREPVRFAEAVASLAPEIDRYVEVSPHPVLLPSIDDTLGAPGRTIASLRRGHPAREAMLGALGALYTAGLPPPLSLFGEASGPAVPVVEPPLRYTPPPAAPVDAGPPAAPLSPVHEALLAIDALQEELDRERARRHEPIAVVGMACRFPGGADTPEALWSALERGIDGVVEIPADRFDVGPWFDGTPGPGKFATKYAGFIDTQTMSGFDPLFFGISPREAMGMDPQQRLLLEVSYEALERAGLSPDRLAGSRTGVFAGVCSSDYWHDLTQQPGGVDAYSVTGNVHSFAVGRIAYALDLQGPSMVVDTACSSSLVAVHLGVQSLRTGECDVALAGGVNLILSPAAMVITSVMNALAPDGRAKAFDARADGTNRGEGCGVVVLERLSDAQAKGHQVLAVIRGSALNHDGHSNGMTAPSVHAQIGVIRAALADADLQPADVQAVETHGTGTTLGDPIEIEALKAVYGAPRADGEQFQVGALKTFIGHTEAAAGVGGLMKTILSLRHGGIPRVLHFETLNPHIDLRGTSLHIPTALDVWPRRGMRRGAVSAFGASGTNAHVIVEEAPLEPPLAARAPGPHVLPLSGHTSGALAARVAALLAELEARPELHLADCAHTLALGRAHHAHRAAVVADTHAEAIAALRALTPAAPPPTAARLGLRGASTAQREACRRWGVELADDAEVWLEPGVGDADLAAALYRAGVDLDWAAYHATRPARLTALPTYPFEKKRHWAPILDEPPQSARRREAPGLRATRLDLAGLEHQLYERALSTDAPSYLAQHRLFGTAILPAAAHVELIAAVAEPGEALVELELDEALSLPEGRARAVQINLGARSRGRRSAAVYAAGSARGDWARHSHGALVQGSRPPAAEPLEQVRARVSRRAELGSLYTRLAGMGMELGPDFRALQAVWVGDGEALGEVALSPALPVDGYRAHPVLLDACFQVAGPVLAELGAAGSPHVPVRIERVHLTAPLGARVMCHARVRRDADERRFLIDLALYDGSGAAVGHVEGLTVQRLSSRAGLGLGPSGLLDWLYRLDWEPAAAAAPAPAATASQESPWWVLAGADGLGDALARALPEAWVIRAGASYTEREREVTLRPEAPEDWARLRHAAGRRPRGVIHTWSIGHAGPRDTAEAARLGPRAILELAKHALEPEAPVQLVLVTRGAVSTPTSLGASLTWGLGRALVAERPGLVRLLDVDADTSPEAVLAELGQAEPEVAFDGDQRRVCRLTRALRADVATRPYAWRADASYLVIGGLGAVGFDVARRMVAGGARHLVLAGRTRPPALEMQLLQLGRLADVRVVTLDVSDRAAVDALIDELVAADPPLRGVVHSAGVYQDAVLTNQTWPAFERVFAPKVDGTLSLAAALERHDPAALDFVVYFASGASTIGTAGQSNYAAANAFQDAMARHQRAAGVRALSINWGPWGEVGGAERRALEEVYRAKGVGTIDPEGGFVVLEHLLAGAPEQVTVLPIDWPRFAEAWPDAKTRPLYARLVAAKGNAATAAVAGVPILQALASAAEEERHGLIVKHVSGIVARMLCVEPAAVDVHAPLSNLGMDSLVALQVKHKIELDLGVAVPVVELLRGAPLDELCRSLDPARAAPTPAPAISPAPTEMGAAEAAALLQRVGDLSDDEVQAELRRLMA